ncbi:hypothetical protein [Halorubrum sp. 2020YC2]|uniref:hypothetical protein n=1 Tax=Halorubrum sp. 2020YC2 TaxID=2836432 RepID=UPI001BEAF08D|nr:hypothetical protein [Halorubrum sp. 2020YC2]QWC18994.1 hypothetical protein KI388_12860 [Halorubrum sp. 2020YC2]
MSDGYRQVGSFESDPPSAVGVGRDVIAFGLDDRVTLVSGRERTAIDHDDPILDLAVADRLLVLSPETLTAYSLDGDQVWSHDAGDAYAVAGAESRECCGILDADTLRVVEVAGGRERFAVDRTRPGTPDDAFLATPTGFVIATWSFLTAVDGDGEVAFDRDLSAVVRSVGVCDGTVVAALQSDRLVGLDRGSGEDRWRTELDARQVAPVGKGSVLVSAADGVLDVTADGVTKTVPDLSTGDVYASGDGAVVCSVRDGTIATYVLDRDRIDVAVLTDSVGVGGTVDVEVSNPTEQEQTVDLSLDVDGCSLSPAERTVTIDGEDSTVADFPVASVRREGRADAIVAADGDEVGRGTVEVEDAASGGLAVETVLHAARIDDGVAEIGVTVENVGGVPLDAVRLLEAGTEATDIAPGDAWEGTVTRPYEPETRVSVGLEVTRGDRRREYAPTCTLPSRPTIDAAVERDALRATVAVADGVPVEDRLVVEMPGAGRVRSPVTIDGDELLLLVPQYESGVARIALDALDAEKRVRVPGNGTFTTSSSAGGRDRDRSRSSRETGGTRRSPNSSESGESTTPHRSTASTGDPSETGSSPARDSERSGSDEVAESRNRSADAADSRNRSNERTSDRNRQSSSTTNRAERESSRDSEETAEDRTESSVGGPTEGRSESGTGGEPSLSATRRAPERAPGVGHAVRDRIVVENDGEPVESVEIAFDDGDNLSLGRLDRGAAASVDRFVAAGEAGELTLPSAAVEVSGKVVSEVDARQLSVSDDAIGVLATVDPDDGALTAVVENGTDRQCRVTGVDPGPDGGRASLSTAVDAGASGTVSATVGERPAPGDAVPVSFWIESDGEERRIDVLAAADGDAAGASDGGEPALTPGISSDTQVAGEYSSVVLVFENDGDEPLTDVSVVADGDPIDSMFYSPARRERVEPGDRIEHYVDLESGYTEPGFEATVSYAVDGTEQEYVARAAGPAVDDESAWTADLLAAWSIDRIDAATPSLEFPSRVSTPPRSEN